MDKSVEMQDTVDNVSMKLFGRKVNGHICVTCGNIATEFKDELSLIEWSISHMCQKCQDEVFEA